MVIRNLRQEPGDLRAMMALLKALWKLRPPGEPEAPGARFIRRWREKRLLARLERDWPGGLVLHRTGDLVHVPSPLDAPRPPRPPPSALCASGGPRLSIARLGCDRYRREPRGVDRAVRPQVGRAGRVLAIEPTPRCAAALESALAANALRQAEIVRCAVGGHDGVAQFAVPVVTSTRADTGTARIGPACAGHDTLQVPLRSLDSLGAERGST